MATMQDAVDSCLRSKGFDVDIEHVTSAEASGYADSVAVPDFADEAEQDAFTDALFGPSGCLDAAAAEIARAEPGLSPASDDLNRRRLDEDLEDLHMRALAEPELVIAEADWVRCMDDLGYDFDGIVEADDAAASVLLSEAESDEVAKVLEALEVDRKNCDPAFYAVYSEVIERVDVEGIASSREHDQAHELGQEHDHDEP